MARDGRIEEKIAPTFKVEKTRSAGKFEGQFSRIEHLENDDFVACRREHRERCFKRVDWGKQIADEQDEPAFACEFGNPLERRHEIGCGTFSGFFQCEHQMP